jgi:hypothetical protein
MKKGMVVTKMQNGYYIIHLDNHKNLMGAMDMLRYESCYHARVDAITGEVTLWCVRFTPERWKSFNIEKIRSTFHNCTKAELSEKYTLASGFFNAVQFVGGLLELRDILL